MGIYRSHFNNEIQNPTAETNHHLTYHMKLKNYVIQNHFFNMVLSGIATYSFRSFFGHQIDMRIIDKMGQRRGVWAQIFIYLGIFHVTMMWMETQERLNINHLVNMREENSSVLVHLTMQHFAHKVNQEVY